jgi:hypothetical protein
LVIVILLSISINSIHLHYYTLASADFLSLDPKIETFDQAYLLAANQSEWKMSGLGGFLKGFQLANCLFGQFFHPFSQIPSLNQKTLVLRC